MMRRLVTTRFVWHGMNKDITAWAKTCLSCQRAKIHHQVTAPLQQFATPDGRFDSIHVDIVGLFPSSRGTSYSFTIVDRFMRWPEAIPMSDGTALSCARALLENGLPRFGVPTDIMSDRGRRQFTSVLWTELSKLLGTQLHSTTAYHPQANGLVERFHRQLKASPKARLHGQDWRDELPLVLLGIRSSGHSFYWASVLLSKRSWGVHPPNLYTERHCVFQVNSSRRPLGQPTRLPRIYCQYCVNPCVDYEQNRRLNIDIAPLTYQLHY